MAKFKSQNILLDDNQSVKFGTSEDVVLSWDGTNLTAIPLFTGTTNFQLGSGTEVIGLRFGASGQVITSVNSSGTLSSVDTSLPTSGTVKSYVDLSLQGLDPKASCNLCTAATLPAYTRTANTLDADANGVMADIDGVTPTVGDRVLLKNGAAGADNGIYEVTDVGSAGTPWQMVRADDADTSAKVTHGMYSWITEGTANVLKAFIVTTADPITLNTTAITFDVFNAASGLPNLDQVYSQDGNTVLVDNQNIVWNLASSSKAWSVVSANDTVSFTGDGGGDIDAVINVQTLDIDATGAISLDTTSTVGITSTGISAVTIASTLGNVVLDSNGGVSVVTLGGSELDISTSASGGIDMNATGGAVAINASDSVSIDSGSTLKVGGAAAAQAITIGNITSTTSVSVLAGSGDILIDSAGGDVIFDDGNKLASTHDTPLNLSDASTEWDTFETNFGEVSLINAINQAANAAETQTLDAVYSQDGNTVTVDNQNVDWQLASGKSWLVSNGADNFTLAESGTDSLSITSALEDAALTVSGTAGLYNGSYSVTVNASQARMADGPNSVSLNATTGVNVSCNVGTLNIGTGGRPIVIGPTGNTLTLNCTTPTYLMDINGGTGGIDIDTLDGGPISIDAIGAPSNFTLAATAAADDLTVGVTGAYDASLVLSSTGTGADAIDINATAGGIDIDANSAINMQSDLASAAAITINAASISGGMLLTCGQGGIELGGIGPIGIGNNSSVLDIDIGTNATARTITIGNTTGATLLDIDAGTGGIDANSNGVVDITASASNIFLATTTSGDIAIGAADQVRLIGAEAAPDAVRILASDTAGGIDIDSGTGGISMQSTGAVGLATAAGYTSLQIGSSAAGAVDTYIYAEDSAELHLTGGSVGLTAFSAGPLDIDGTGAVSINSTGGAINVGDDANNNALNLGSGGTRAITIGSGTGAGSLDINIGSGATTMDVGGTLSFDSVDTTNLTMTANNAADKTLSIVATNAGAGDGLLSFQDSFATVTLSETGETGFDNSKTSIVGAVNEVDGKVAGDGTVVKYGTADISNAATTVAVTFSTAYASANYRVMASIVNIGGSAAQYAYTVTTKLTTGFTVTLSGAADSGDYDLEWMTAI